MLNTAPFVAFTVTCTLVPNNAEVVPKNTLASPYLFLLEPNNAKQLRKKVVWTMCNLNPSPGISMCVIIELV